MARVTTPSSSGRALSRLARRTLVQWPELASSYPRARVCRPLLLEQIEDAGPTARRGTLVVVGTHASPFDRLLAMADRAIATGVLPKPALLQTGAAPFRSTNATVRDYLTPSEMDEAMASAKYIVCHGGVGLISGALRHGSRPIVSARLRRHGEHFDDHQLQLIGKLAPLDLLVEAQDEITPDVVRAADAPLAGRRWPAYPSLGEALADEIAQMRR
jgi:UDP-N-acetylglucosamine transferase subunit ALG13